MKTQPHGLLRAFALILLLAPGCSSSKESTGAGGATGGTIGQGGTTGGAVTTGGITGSLGGTGSGGIGGQGGISPAGGAGGSQETCGTHEAFAPRLSVTTNGPGARIHSGTYEGPAVVERSTEDELVVYFEPPRTTMGTGGGTGAGGATAGAPGYHATLSGWRPMPVLPVGAKLWMSKSPDGNQIRDVLFYGVDPWSIWLRDREAGTLILGATRRGASPVGLTNRTAYCSAMNQGCQPGITTYYTVDVQADSPVTLRDSETAAIQLGGRAYDVRLTSRKEPERTFVCADYTPQDGTCFDARAQNLAGISFDMSVLPSCIEGNDRIPYVSTYVPDRVFDGQVFYRGRETPGGSLLFGIGGVTKAYLSAPAEVFPEPSVGQEFWLTAAESISALRGPQQGGVLLATVASGTSPAIAQVLGMTVTSEQDCAYTTDSQFGTEYVRTTVFGSTPPVRIRSGSVGTVTIAGQSYRAAARAGNVTLWK